MPVSVFSGQDHQPGCLWEPNRCESTAWVLGMEQPGWFSVGRLKPGLQLLRFGDVPILQLGAKLAERGATLQELRARGMLVGTGSMVRDQLDELADLGMDGVMIQWMNQDDIAGLAAFAQAAL